MKHASFTTPVIQRTQNSLSLGEIWFALFFSAPLLSVSLILGAGDSDAWELSEEYATAWGKYQKTAVHKRPIGQGTLFFSFFLSDASASHALPKTRNEKIFCSSH